MFCTNCGNQIKPEDKFCAKCGKGRLRTQPASAITKRLSSFLDIDKRFIGSNIVLTLGIGGLLTIGNIAQNSMHGDPEGLDFDIDTLIVGFMFVLGALAYKSAKKRKLGLVTDTSKRRIFEIMAITISLLAVLLQNNLSQRLYIDPAVNVLVPLGIVGSYLYLNFKKA